MWRLSRSISKSLLLRKIERSRYRDFLSKCDSIPIPYHPRGTADQCRRSQNGLYTAASLITPSVEELFISTNLITLSAEMFISSTPNIGAIKSKSKSCLRGTGDQRRRLQNVFYTPAGAITPNVEELYLHKSDHAECSEVYIFNPEYWGEKIALKSNCL